MRKRIAFTLVELLVVISIITILIAISVGVVIRMAGVQENTSTEKTVKIVQSAMERVLKNLRNSAHLDYLSLTGTTKTNLNNAALALELPAPSLIGLREPARRNELVFVDLIIAKGFPTKFSDLSSGTVALDFIPSVNLGNKARINSAFNSKLTVTEKAVATGVKQGYKAMGEPSHGTSEMQNSNCLLLALEANPDGLKDTDLGEGVKVMVEPNPPDPKNPKVIRFIVDGQGKPIQFRLKYKDQATAGDATVTGTVSVELIY